MDEDLIGVYRIVSPNGSCYVGATAVSFSSRWSAHRKDFRTGKTRCAGLRRAFEKYGVDAMRFEILEAVATENAESIWKLEQIWWNKLKAEGVNLYNGEPSGTGSVRHTDETRKKISEALRHEPIEKVCAYEGCGKSFITNRSHASFCSTSCGALHNTGPRRLVYDYDFIYDLYWVQRKSRPEIMRLLGISVGGFQALFSRLEIPMRTRKEAAAIANAVKLTSRSCLDIDCMKSFQPKRSGQKYCTRACADRNRGSSVNSRNKESK